MPRVKAKNPEGRPTSYRPEYCEQVVAFFDVKPYFHREVVTTGKNDYTKTEIVEVPNDLPHLVDFARKIGVNQATLSDWVKKYPEFDEALKNGKALNEKMLAINALRGLYNSTFSIFMAKNKFGWRDEQYLKGEGIENKQTIQIYIPSATAENRQVDATPRTTDAISSIGSV